LIFSFWVSGICLISMRCVQSRGPGLTISTQVCDTSGLSTTIGLFCTTRTPTVMCCDALVAAVNVGGISCLCQTAADLVVQNSMLNRTDLLRLYRECSGRHVPLEIYYGESLFSVPNMNLLLPRLSHNVFLCILHGFNPYPASASSSTTGSTINTNLRWISCLPKFLSTWWGKLLFASSLARLVFSMLVSYIVANIC